MPNFTIEQVVELMQKA